MSWRESPPVGTASQERDRVSKYEIAVANYFHCAAPDELTRFAIPTRGVGAGDASFWIRAVA